MEEKKMITAQDLYGCYVAVITPMRKKRFVVPGLPETEIDFERLFEHIKFLIDAGVRGLLFCGTTGQSATLSHDEHVRLACVGAAFARQYAAERGKEIQIILSAGSNATWEAEMISRGVIPGNPDALLHVTGYYNNPPQAGLREHFTTIADAMSGIVPIIIYLVPSRTKSSLTVSSMVELAAHPNIIGVKDAVDDIEWTSAVLEKTRGLDFAHLSGEDGIIFDMMKRGGKGVICATANRWPAEFERLTQLCLADRMTEAEALQQALMPCVEATFAAKNPIPLHHMLDTLCLRLPMVSVDELDEAEREAVLRKIEVAQVIESFPHMEE
jgi:4-hydroxy-tetrahydrodipicolinate synthase